MAKAGRRARCRCRASRARRLRGAARREPPRPFTKRLAESRIIDPADTSFDIGCSFDKDDVWRLAREALAAIDDFRFQHAMDLLVRRPWGVRAMGYMLRSRPDIVSMDSNGRFPGGGTLLHHAAATRESFVHVLLDHGADPNARDAKNWTPLGYAALNREHGAVVTAHLVGLGADMQVRFGADPQTSNHDGNTPLHIAALRPKASSVEVCKLLIDGPPCFPGVDVNARNNAGQTALGFAVGTPSPTCVEILIAAGAEVTRDVVRSAMWWGSPRALQILFRAERRSVLETFSYVESLGGNEYYSAMLMEDSHSCALRPNAIYIKRILKAGGRKAGAYDAYERDQRKALATIVRRQVVGHRVPPEISDIIVAFWGHPGGCFVFDEWAMSCSKNLK